MGKFSAAIAAVRSHVFWTVIALSYALLVASFVLSGNKPRYPPGVADLLANMFYLDNLLGYHRWVK